MADPVERSESEQPGNAGFKIDDARVKQPYFVQADDLEHQIQITVGTNEESDPDFAPNGVILRTLPKCHPQFPFLVASSINLVGRGKPTVTDSEADDEARPTPIAAQYGLYSEYVGEVEFLQHPWDFLPDDEIQQFTDRYYDEDGKENTVVYVTEWDRYCEVDEETDPKIISATQGQMFYVSNEFGVPPSPGGFAGTPRFPYPETLFKIVWHQVPYRYVSSPRSFLKRFQLRVNQKQFRIQGYDFDEGQLLYLTYKYRRYQPPFPMPDELLTGTRFALEKWVDLTLTFAVVDRQPPDEPAPQNPNHIFRHHNALPWFYDRNFHGVASGVAANPATWKPMFLSGPVPHILFMDPDAVVPNPAPVG